MKPLMACHWKRLLPSLKHCDMNGINGCQPDGRISRRKTGKSAPLACPCGQIKCCKKSSAKYLRRTLSRSSVTTRTDFAQGAAAIPHSGKSIANGVEPCGS